MGERYQAFLSRMAAIKAIDPRHPVFPLDGSWIPPGFEAWWERWSVSGDISAHDDYPLEANATDIAALSRSILRSVRLNGERKPVWLTLQAFGGAAELRPAMRLPTAGELRGMVFTAIIHGAAGIILLAYDSDVTRQGHVIGIAPQTPESCGEDARATPRQVARSRALWAGAVELNAELDRLTPRLRSPTASLHYEPLGGGFQFTRTIASVVRLNGDGSQAAIEPAGSMFRDALNALAAAVYEVRFR
jgi:hypothetical protein